MARQAFTATALIYCGIFVASSLYVMIPLHPAVSESYQVTIAHASLSSSLFIIAYALGLLLFGFLADQLPLSKIMLAGMGVLTLLTSLLAFVDSIEAILLLRVFQGLLAASFAPLAFGYCFSHFTTGFQGVVIALINTGFLFAGVFGQIISAAFASAFSVSSVFVAFSFFYLSCFIFLWFTLQPSANAGGLNIKKLTVTILSCLRNPIVRWLYVIAFFLLFPIMLFYGAFEIYLYTIWKDFPIPLQLFRLISLIGIFPSFFTSYVLKKFKPRTVLQFHLGIMAAGFLPALIHLNVGTIAIASFLMIVSTSLTIPMVVLLVGRHSSAGTSGIAIYSCTLLTGAAVGSALAPEIAFFHVLWMIPMLFAGLALLAKVLPDN
ncbi:MFS transporter [Sediminibacillus albus]|uniref:Predicted arabinose efflux permease, MFS family n=1 Tax=Sediminibacillus albus TaxID=407036 RepID=A0A1G8XC85_9BACI|nr:MFS transporter [Sediminibacillus albus]SDJ87964.1 Predicted arabinose efflux permease, MFS family [Sediminibacillus albus]